MVVIRRYMDDDARAVGIVIADTYAAFNLADIARARRTSMLGPFAFARSPMPAHRDAIADAISGPSVWVAERDGEITGVLRGGRSDDRGRTVLSSLFVAARHQGHGTGRLLVKQFEGEYAARGARIFKVSATLVSVPFYQRVGYKRTTGIRVTHSFGEPGLLYQPMKKALG